MMTWTIPMVEDFADKLEYLERIDAKDDDTFMFDGHEFNVGYARYLLQHLRTRLGVKP